MVKKQSHSNMPQIVNDCRELLLWIIPHIDKLPKNRRYTLGEKLENRILTVMENLVSAAYAKNKRNFLITANRDLEIARQLWRLCFDFRAIPIKSYEHGGKLMIELGKQLGGWLRTTT